MTEPVETMRLCGDRVDFIDQRALPQRFDYVACRSADDVAAAIHSMVVRGAPAIGCAAAYGVAVEALRLARCGGHDFHTRLAVGIDQLARSRPTAVNLFWALDRMKRTIRAVATAPPAAIADALVVAAVAMHEEDLRINRAMGEHGARLLNDGCRVLTHCNAGALATAGHGTALGVIRSAVAGGKRIHVIADETRPFLQGARLTAWELSQDRIPVTLITDNMAGHLMSRGEVDAVIVGTDRVAANGDVANKIGTYMVAVLAHRHRIPFYVACPLSTIDLSIPGGDHIPIEERSADEVRGFGSAIWAPANVAVRNPAFDITPAELVTALITEEGVVPGPDRDRIAALFAPT